MKFGYKTYLPNYIFITLANTKIYLIIFQGVAVDGQYINRPFMTKIRSLFGGGSDSEFYIPFTWDRSHLMNCAVIDVRDGSKKKGIPPSEFFTLFVSRANTYGRMLSHGKGFALLQAICKRENLKLRIPQVYAVQR